MKAIDFTKYPKVLPYVENFIGKSHFKPFEYNPLDEETFIKVVESWIDDYEKNIDTMVKNTMEIYNLTSGETGYSALGNDWESRREVAKRNEAFGNRSTEESTRKSWFEKFTLCINYLYQGMGSNNKFKSGATGCLITCSFTVELLDSDYKSVKWNVVSDFNMSLNIGCGEHTEIDMYDM